MIQPTAKQRLQYFVGRPVSVFTRPINMPLTPSGVVKYCVGIVESVDECGVMLISQDGRRCYFYHDNICFIGEEEGQVIEKEVKKTPPDLQQTGEFVDIDALESLSKLSS